MSSESHSDLSAWLQLDDVVRATALTTVGVIAVSDQWLVVAQGERVALNVRLDQVRRIEFDIEKGRPATLVIVPDLPRHEAQVLAIPADQVVAATDLLAFVAERLIGRSHA